MATRRVALLTLVLSVVMPVVVASAQGWRGSGGWGPQGAYGRLYNPATVETVTGKVVAVERMSPMKGMGAGIHLKLRTDRETIPVHLGPAWYIERLDTKIEIGDQLEVRGSRVIVAGKPSIIASEVKKDSDLLKLRDDAGIPAWSGWRRGQ